MEFAGTNVLTEAHDGGARLFAEFYSAATRKLGMVADWTIHRPDHADSIRASRQRRYKIAWWDALVVNSAIEVGSKILWTEDLARASGRRR